MNLQIKFDITVLFLCPCFCLGLNGLICFCLGVTCHLSLHQTPHTQHSQFTAMIILHFHLQLQFRNELFHILHIISLLTGDMNSIN